MRLQLRERLASRVHAADVEARERHRPAVRADPAVLGRVRVHQVEPRERPHVQVEMTPADRVQVARTEPQTAENAPAVVSSYRRDSARSGRSMPDAELIPSL